ncbi:AUGMIN subunit 5 [Solanum tuberosum]|uniref:AUGMIN subunit 5 n=1 Tax=Solanum tuberosum TaxID=4113 RepID=UPI0003D24F31|nr:PREDICTED: AUGMIN subunit 5 [Solanum tuberosum]
MAGSVQPEAILEWLQKEMGYQPLGSYAASSKAAMPTIDSLRKICRGNMIPIWNFLLNRVKSEKTVEKVHRNILVHGRDDGNGNVNAVDSGRSKGRRKEKVGVVRDSGSGSSSSVGLGSAENSREFALQERDLAEKEVERLRQIVRRQRKELKARMLEVSREEAERKRMLDERSNYRHKQVMLEAYDQQCEEAAKIFSEYHKRLSYYINQARNVKRSSVDSSAEVVTTFQANEKDVYPTFKGTKSVEDVILIETTWERNIRKACECLAMQMAEKIRNSFPAFEGNGIHMNSLLQAAKLGIDLDGDLPDEVRDAIVSCLKSPPQLLQAINAYAQKLKTTITREIEKVDVRADAEILRYKYENDRVMDASSPDVASPLHYQLYGNGKIGGDTSSKGSQNQLLERQKAHVQQFLATEDALNKAAEARKMSQQLLKRLQGTDDAISSHSLVIGGTSKSMSSLRQLELEVWTKEREAAGLKASVNTLMSEIQRLNKLCAERKEAEDSLRKKWKKIEEFDARRSELESIYSALLKASMDAAAFWSHQPLAAKEYSSSTIIPACTVLVDLSHSAKDLIEQEVSAFYQTPDNTLYMLPSTPQALLESMGVSGSTGPEAVAAAEKNAAILTARAGARDPSAIPSICRISAALQYPADLTGTMRKGKQCELTFRGLDVSDAGLAAVLESLGFCMKFRGSEASILEDLEKAINLVHTRRDLVESGRALLDHANKAQNEYERTTNYCLDLAAEQEKTATENWLQELDVAIGNAKHCLDEECKYARGLVDEWWEQPASTVVDWVTVDGQNVAAWWNDVKQLMAFHDQQLH